MEQVPKGTNHPLHPEMIQIVQNIWAMMLSMQVVPCSPEKNPSGPGFAGCVHILGDWHGSVSLILSQRLAARAAAAMFGLPDDQIERQHVEDALKEITNMTGGNLKALLGERCILSVPRVVDVSGAQFDVPESEILFEQHFSADEVFVVRLHEDKQDLRLIIEEMTRE